MIIYKVCSKAIWEEIRQLTSWNGSPHDLSDGFIHFSTAAQARGTAAKYFARFDDLIIAAIDCSLLGTELRWEAARDGALFPHLYTSLPATAVLWTKPLPCGGNGLHVFPDDFGLVP